MDYFCQTPMVIYLDNSSIKNSNVLFYNLPVNFNNNKISLRYLKIDDKLIQIGDKINSNQIIRYNNNMTTCITIVINI